VIEKKYIWGKLHFRVLLIYIYIYNNNKERDNNTNLL
jgi:hypothetical protein